jgi:hypothetical protein
MQQRIYVQSSHLRHQAIMKRFLLLLGALFLCCALHAAAEDPTQGAPTVPPVPEEPPVAKAGEVLRGLRG